MEFERIANRFANALISRGIHKGDRVILLMMNCLEWLPLYFGVLKTGAWAVPLNFRFTAKDIRYCAEIAEANKMLDDNDIILDTDPRRVTNAGLTQARQVAQGGGVVFPGDDDTGGDE